MKFTAVFGIAALCLAPAAAAWRLPSGWSSTWAIPSSTMTPSSAMVPFSTPTSYSSSAYSSATPSATPDNSGYYGYRYKA